MGRTKSFQKRMDAHSKNPYRKNLNPIVVETGLSYYESRGLEEWYILVYGTVVKDNYTNNQIHGISPYNPNGEDYLASAFSYLLQRFDRFENLYRIVFEE